MTHRHRQDIECALDRHRFLVGAIGGRKGIEHVADSHDFGLERDLVALELVRVTRAVEFLVVRAGNHGNSPNLFGPGNLHQEIEAVHHVRFDLVPLVRVEAALGNGEEAHFFRRQQVVLDAARVAILPPRNVQ